MIQLGRVPVNWTDLAEPNVESGDLISRTGVRGQPAHHFSPGDNRPRSSDSREFGEEPMDYARGGVEVRLWLLLRIDAVREYVDGPLQALVREFAFGEPHVELGVLPGDGSHAASARRCRVRALRR